MEEKFASYMLLSCFCIPTENGCIFSTRYKIEEQASKFYTRTAFGKFKEMMEETTALMINPVEGSRFKFELRRCDSDSSKIRVVVTDPVDRSYECSCNRFHMNGILCHTF